MFIQRFRTLGFIAAIAILALAAFGSNYRIGLADMAASKPGLAPQFSRWPVPIYTSNVNSTSTWASNSYEINTKDSRAKVISWYLGRLKNRATQIHKDSTTKGVPAQLAVDGADYFINLMILPTGTSINVVKLVKP
jgi:hypothetical protein